MSTKFNIYDKIDTHLYVLGEHNIDNNDFKHIKNIFIRDFSYYFLFNLESLLKDDLGKQYANKT